MHRAISLAESFLRKKTSQAKKRYMGYAETRQAQVYDTYGLVTLKTAVGKSRWYTCRTGRLPRKNKPRNGKSQTVAGLSFLTNTP